MKNEMYLVPSPKRCCARYSAIIQQAVFGSSGYKRDKVTAAQQRGPFSQMPHIKTVGF